MVTSWQAQSAEWTHLLVEDAEGTDDRCRVGKMEIDGHSSKKLWYCKQLVFHKGSQPISNFEHFFSSMCFKCFKDHSKKSTNTCPFIFSSSIPLSFFFHAGSGGSCWSLENYWKFQAELGGSGGPFAQGLVQSWDGPTVPWVVMDWLRPKMDGWWNSWFPRHRCNVWIWLGDFRFTS